MSRKLIFHSAAKTEFLDASKWYERRQTGLAKSFIEEIDRAISMASENPFQLAVVFKNIRRVTTSRFPYSIYFLAEPERIFVLAVFHSRRDPSIWQARD